MGGKYLVILFGISVIVFVEGYTGGDCYHDRAQSAGLCINFNNCESALKNVRDQNSKFYPQICRFENTDAYVCCPIGQQVDPIESGETHSETKTKSSGKAEEKCKEYSEKLLNVVLDAKNRQIIDGENATEGEFPHMAAIGYGNEQNPTWACGGALISENFVLTVAHCKSHPLINEAKFVQLGENTLHNPSNTRKVYRISKIHTYPDFKAPRLYDDIALLQLETPVQFSPYIKPACLHTNTENTSFQKFKTIVTGWGVTEADADQTSENLQKVDLQYFDNCQSHFTANNRRLPNGINPTSQLCFGSRIDRKDACKGDSGGPIQFFDFSIYLHRVIGLVSSGKSCGTVGIPGIYTKVANYIEWIEDIVWN